jgi:AcrR family transcriptional regulator
MVDRRQEILDAALALADEGGLDAVSMRAVAQRVGVTAMALYPHFSGKEALLDGLVGRVLAELPRPDPRGSWQERLSEMAHAVRELAHRHPSVVPLLFSRPAVTPDAVRVVDAIYQALLDAGVPPDQVARLERMLSTFVLGYAVSEVGGRFAGGTLGTRERRGQLSGAELPAHHQLGSWLDAPWSWDAEFEADLAGLTQLILLAAGPGQPPGA